MAPTLVRKSLCSPLGTARTRVGGREPKRFVHARWSVFASCASHTDNRSRVDLPSGNVNSERLSVLPGYGESKTSG